MKHTEIKKCPRCGNRLECNNYNILKCACIGVPLSTEARQAIAEKYVDCLCMDCLAEYANMKIMAKNPA